MLLSVYFLTILNASSVNGLGSANGSIKDPLSYFMSPLSADALLSAFLVPINNSCQVGSPGLQGRGLVGQQGTRT